MKKYTTLPVDYTTLATEAMAHLNATTDVEDAEHMTNAFHWLGMKSDLISAIPSIGTTFASLPLEVNGLAHRTVASDALFNHSPGVNVLLVPLADCEHTVVKIFNLVPGAVQHADSHYDDADCELAETIPLTTGLFIKSDTVYTIETTDRNLADILVVFFVEDTASYFA